MPYTIHWRKHTLYIGRPWFESRQDHIFLPCIYSFLSLLRTLFVRSNISCSQAVVKKRYKMFLSRNLPFIEIWSPNNTVQWHDHKRQVLISIQEDSQLFTLLSELHHHSLTLYHTCLILRHSWHTAVENIVRKGETACNKQFLLFSPCFLPYMYLFSTLNTL